MAMQANPQNLKPDEFFNQNWAHLSVGINKNLTAFATKSSMPPKEWWTYHDACFHMCIFPDETAKMPDRLYPKIAELIGQFVEQQAQALKDKTGEILLREYLNIYQNYCHAATSIRKITTYMHRFWIPGHKNESILGVQVRELIPLSFVIWRQKCYVPLKNQLLKAVLELIHNERTGQKVDMTLVRTLLQSYEADALGIDDKGFYDREFEAPFLEVMKVFYITESTTFIEENGVSEYMKKAEGRIENEQGNAKQYMLSSTEPKLKLALNEALISKHMETIQASFQGFMKDQRHDDMRRVFYLLSRITDGLNHTSKTFEEYITKVDGNELIESQRKKTPKDALANAVPFIKALIALQKKYTDLLSSCFSNNALFKAALDKAFTEIMNKNTGKWPMTRLLTLFIDHILKGKEKETSSEHEVDETLDAVVQLLSYLVDKDEFEEISRKALCRRLLNTAAQFNENWERSFVAKLKAKNGDAFTRRLQGMFTDAQDETVTRTRKKFEEWNGGSPKIDGVTLQVQVLNECFWPLSASDKVPIGILPTELSNCVQKFDQFYKADTQNRKLRWIYGHGSVQLNANLKGKSFIFITTPLQASVLLLYNNVESMTFLEIFQALWGSEGGAAQSQLRSSGNNAQTFEVKIDDMLRTAIGPLFTPLSAAVKFKVLNKEPEDGENVKNTDVIALVQKLAPVKRKRIVFPAGSAVKRTEADQSEDQQMLMKQREFEADAAMVRVMKTRNVLKWNDLQIQTVDSLKNRFKPETVLLKKRLESLIDRKFLERDPNDRNLIKYVA